MTKKKQEEETYLGNLKELFTKAFRMSVRGICWCVDVAHDSCHKLLDSQEEGK